MRELPRHWCWSRIAEVGRVSGGLTKNAKRHLLADVRPLIKVGNIYFNELRTEDFEEVGVASGEIERAELRAGDLLIVEGNGSVDQIGRVALWDGRIPGAVHQNHLIKVRAGLAITAKFLLWWLISPEGRRFITDRASSTSGLLTLSISKVESLPSPIAPLKEQERITSMLEELFSELDAGVEALRRALRRLVRYRQSLLQAAVTGELTRGWREEHAPDVQLGKGNVVPSGWSASSLGDLLSHIEAGKNFAAKGTPPAEGEVGILKISAVTWNVYDEDESKTVPSQDLVNPRLFVRPGDFLISRANTLELVGACVIAHRVTKRLMLSDKVLRLHFKDDALKPWVLAFLKSRKGRNELESRASGNQLSMRNISQAKLETIPVPLPPEPARHIILAELDRRLSAADALESTLQASLRRAEHMRQSILERAFRGELVPQDPNDAPAEALLERLRNKKPTEVPAPPHRGRPPKAYAEAAPSQSPRHRGRPRKEAKA